MKGLKVPRGMLAFSQCTVNQLPSPLAGQHLFVEGLRVPLAHYFGLKSLAQCLKFWLTGKVVPFVRISLQIIKLFWVGVSADKVRLM